MRQIKASEVKPGMTIQFDLEGWDVKGTVGTVTVVPYEVWIYTEMQGDMSLDLDAPVTVLSEPQPEEPTAFGARVVAGGRRFVLADDDTAPWMDTEFWMWRTWAEVCAIGPVTVIDADPSWTLPDNSEADEVPTRIQSRGEWPEDDTQLRHYKWETSGPTGGAGDTWEYVDGAWTWYNDSDSTRTSVRWPAPASGDFPLTRIN